MRIGEMAEKTGLSISNIRFYEKKGLIGPDREADSKYRSYSEADLKRLNLIILLRKMDLSVEVIGKVLENQISMEDALEQQLIDLSKKQQELQSSIDLCSKMIADRAYEDIDVDLYLNYVKEEENNGRSFAKFDDFIDDFSGYTGFRPYFSTGFPFLGGMANPGIYRIFRILWCVVFLVLPAFGIIEALLDESGPRMLSVTFWSAWIIFFAMGYLNYKKEKNKPSE